MYLMCNRKNEKRGEKEKIFKRNLLSRSAFISRKKKTNKEKQNERIE